MADCAPEYVSLPCNLSGIAFTAQALMQGGTSLVLAQGHGDYFPDVPAGQFFYASIIDPCGDCCEEVKVVGKDGDTLSIQRINPTCDCIPSQARVRYNAYSKAAILAMAAELPFTVVPPLIWDCETRTLSIDCEVMMEQMIASCLEAGDESGGDLAQLTQQVAANTQAISENTAALGTKADKTQVNTLSATVSAQQTDIDNNSQAVASLSTSMTGKASTSDLNSVQTQVSANATAIANTNSNVNSLSGQVTTLSNSIGDKAEQSQVDDLSSQLATTNGNVSNLNSTVTTHTSQIAANTQQIAVNTQAIQDLQNP